MNIFLEWSAFGIGTIGTLLWAFNFKLKGRSIEGWFWLISAIFWIWFAALNSHAGLAARDLLGVALYITGIVKSMKTKVDHTQPDLVLTKKPNCQICNCRETHQP